MDTVEEYGANKTLDAEHLVYITNNFKKIARLIDFNLPPGSVAVPESSHGWVVAIKTSDDKYDWNTTADLDEAAAKYLGLETQAVGKDKSGSRMLPLKRRRQFHLVVSAGKNKSYTTPVSPDPHRLHKYYLTMANAIEAKKNREMSVDMPKEEITEGWATPNTGGLLPVAILVALAGFLAGCAWGRPRQPPSNI